MLKMKPWFKSEISAVFYAFFRTIFVTSLFLYVPLIALLTLLYERDFLSVAYNIYFALYFFSFLPFLFIFFTAVQVVHYFVCRKSLSGTTETVTFLHEFAAVMSLLFIVVYVFVKDAVPSEIAILSVVFPLVSVVLLIAAYILLKIHLLTGNIRLNEEYLTQAGQFRQVKIITAAVVVCIFAVIFLVTAL